MNVAIMVEFVFEMISYIVRCGQTRRARWTPLSRGPRRALLPVAAGFALGTRSALKTRRASLAAVAWKEKIPSICL